MRTFSRTFKGAVQLRGGIGMARRWNSTEAGQGQKPVSPHIGFYKTFARPIAKVLLMATVTYQLAYWTWVKLEKDEEKRGKNAEIAGLEKQLGKLTKGKGGAAEKRP